MKKILIIFGLILSMTSLAYATMFCCPPEKTKEQCCAERGRLYCENDGKCRTRCKCAPDECCGCINPDGDCCTWCPSAEVCEGLGKCQKIGTNGCYECIKCDETCPSPRCLNQEGKCCDSCPRTCPEGECLVNVDGCYQCGIRNGGGIADDDDDDVDDDDDDDDDDNLPELPVPGGGFCIWECALGIWDAEHKNITPKPNAIVKLPSSCLIPEDINDTEEVLEYDGICKCEDGYTVMAIAESVEGTIYQSSTVLCCKYPCGTTDCCEKEGECVLTDNSGPEYRKGTCCPNGNGGLDEGGEVVCCDEDQAYEAAARGCCDKIDGAYPPILTEKEVKECYEIYAGDTDTNYCTVKRLKCDDNSECDGEGECKCNDGEAPCGWNFVGDTPMQQQCCSSD